MSTPAIRRLRSHHRDLVFTYFQQLPPETLRQRFGGAVGPAFVAEYAGKVLAPDALVFGAFDKDVLVGIGELRPMHDSTLSAYEAAFSVAPGWQDHGLGDALLSRVLTAAQNRAIREVHILCRAENLRMRHLARKHDAVLAFDNGDVDATLTPPPPTAFSVAREINENYLSLTRSAFRWPM